MKIYAIVQISVRDVGGGDFGSGSFADLRGAKNECARYEYPGFLCKSISTPPLISRHLASVFEQRYKSRSSHISSHLTLYSSYIPIHRHFMVPLLPSFTPS